MSLPEEGEIYVRQTKQEMPIVVGKSNNSSVSYVVIESYKFVCFRKKFSLSSTEHENSTHRITLGK